MVTFNDYSAYTLVKVGGVLRTSQPDVCYSNSMSSGISLNVAELLTFLNDHSVSGESRYEFGIEKAFELLMSRRDVISNSEYCVGNI